MKSILQTALFQEFLVALATPHSKEIFAQTKHSSALHFS